MKTRSLLLLPLFLLTSMFLLPFRAQAQGDMPVVKVFAPDSSASESGDPGRFLLRRDGPTNMALNVYCVLGGTASNGVDYATIPNWISVPAGVREVPIPVTPIDDKLVEDREAVILQLARSPTLPPVNYVIGSPSNAVVFIGDNDGPPPTNQPPAVRISGPPNGATFNAPANVLICADAHDFDGYVVSVEFFSGTNSLGTKTNTCPMCANAINPFCLVWSNVPPGEYVLTARATDDDGASSTSEPVRIRVVVPNAPPVVKITSPTNGTVFIAPTDIEIDAMASDTDDNVVRVDFFAGDHFIGSAAGTNSSIYSIIWSNALPGLYGLRARGVDDRGAAAFSESVRITVTGTNRPPTNLPPIVTIAALDPLASEGTNSWRWRTNATVGAADAIRLYGGTNTATFAVRRSGPTNSALTVSYEIRGSASNGVDYVTIPEAVTIPAGERSARIVVVPIDDAIPECPETVVLRLSPDTNTPPPYVVGWPSRAAAVIVDNDSPPPDTRLLCDGTFHLRVPAPVGFNYRLESSADALHWVPVCTNTVTELGVFFAEPDTQESPTRFYRIVPEASLSGP